MDIAYNYESLHRQKYICIQKKVGTKRMCQRPSPQKKTWIKTLLAAYNSVVEPETELFVSAELESIPVLDPQDPELELEPEPKLI
jgi:hypothetical protein